MCHTLCVTSQLPRDMYVLVSALRGWQRLMSFELLVVAVALACAVVAVKEKVWSAMHIHHTSLCHSP